MISNGLFTSKMIYCLPVFGQVWGLESYDQENRRSIAFTKEDNRKLQVLQNRVCRLKTGYKYDVPTAKLLHDSQDLSVHQLTAYHTLLMAHKIIVTQKPQYLSEKLKLKATNYKIEANRKLIISRSGFIYRSSRLFNMLPLYLRMETRINIFKTKVKKWVQNHIELKPD